MFKVLPVIWLARESEAAWSLTGRHARLACLTRVSAV